MKYRLETSRPAKVRFDLEQDLNPQQRAAVLADPGYLLVLAGAGTGKTRTLTYRVAHLVARGAPPDRIMLVTFTNRAAREMLSRVEGLLAVDMGRCLAGTFHHVGHRILRQHGEAIGLSPDFGILDPEDARTLLSAIVSELGLEKLTARRFPQPKVLANLISLATGTCTPLAQVLRERTPQLLEQLPTIERVARDFAARKRQLNVCDFDDLLALWHALLTSPETEAARQDLRGAVDHVLVDEYQDINALQGALCDEMAARCGSLTCVGDDAQSIYSFRGADFAQIHRFADRHPGARVLELTLNYRSTPQILSLANRSIEHNLHQHRKHLKAVSPSGPVPAVLPLRDVFQQAEFVAQRVLELHHDRNLPLRDMAVLYRNHSHSLELQVELGRRQIPFAVRSGVRFFEQAHVKDVVAYLRARENPQDQLAWIRLLRLWPGIGARKAAALAEQLAPVDVANTPDPDAVLREAAGRARGRAKDALATLAKLWTRLRTPELADPGATIRAVVEAHYADYAQRAFPNAEARTEDLTHLASYASTYDSAREFLAQVALVQGITAESVTGADAPDDHLQLSTIHQAKGLEWTACFVLWLADGRFPTRQALRTPESEEEERRLFYVAATRAAEELYLCYPTLEDTRQGPARLLRPSRFLAELDRPPAVFERWEVEEVPADPPER